MLYISTRNRTDSFTAFRTLNEDFTPDGGMFVPLRFPVFSSEELADLFSRSFGEIVAHILNLFFSGDLTGWDVDFCIGRRPIKPVSMNHKLIVAEMWHNHDSSYRFLEESLYRKLYGSSNTRTQPTQWARIAIQIAVLFGIWSELSCQNPNEMDIAVGAEDFSVPVAAWYSKKMGLPVRKIICSSKDNSTVWDLIHRGEFSTAAAAASGASYPACIERLIFDTLGLRENLRYLEACNKKATYHLPEDQLIKLNNGFYVSVIGNKRIDSIRTSIYRSCNYISDEYTALSFGGLQNYRAQTGSSHVTVMLAQCSPLFEGDILRDLLGISADEIRKRVNNP